MDSAMLMNISDQQIDDALNDESGERVGKLNKAIKKLDAEERALISLFYNEEKTIGEIALILGLTESNAKVKLHRIRKKLGIKEQVNTIANRYNKWLYLFHISSC
jgi:RNA polymerase sigma factor (sigma-70 family)